MTTKRAKILAMWDLGKRDYREIAAEAGSTPATVRTCLSLEGRLAGRMRNGPAPRKTEKIVSMWTDGERDLAVIASRSGSTLASVRALLNRSGISCAGHDRRWSGVHCRLPISMVEWAVEHGRDPEDLAQKLLAVIADEDMYEAVLDEGAVVNAHSC